MLAILARRRSTKVIHFKEPGPSAEQLTTLLGLAARVPDHGKLGPWRFVIIEGEGRVRAGETLAQALQQTQQQADETSLQLARNTFLRAPVCVMVVSAAVANTKIPEWEQHLSSGAVCFALLLAAHAMGYGGCWLTGWPVYNAHARMGLGLEEHEQIAGFIHLGTATEAPTERTRADFRSRVSRF